MVAVGHRFSEVLGRIRRIESDHRLVLLRRNGKTYSKSFGLTLGAIAVTGIAADTTGYTF
jgi:hypothetical protein